MRKDDTSASRRRVMGAIALRPPLGGPRPRTRAVREFASLAQAVSHDGRAAIVGPLCLEHRLA